VLLICVKLKQEYIVFKDIKNNKVLLNKLSNTVSLTKNKEKELTNKPSNFYLVDNNYILFQEKLKING